MILCCALAAGPVLAADWPTYRGDAGRSGYTTETLTKDLSLRWTYGPHHAPRPAWSGRDTRMPFDLAYRPVIAGDVLLFGSSADDTVRALDVATGAERWTFFTDGPVRFAPAVADDRVFAVSDDGHLYCLSLDEGKLLWKFRGGPSDDKVLGNGRIVSRWPARGGPVVADGVVYFAAGIWPSEGIYVYAIDAAGGKAVWCNDSSGGIYMPQPHGGANAHSGISAQGDLVIAGDRLLVPTGRAVPAVLDRADGRFLYFHLQANRGTGGSSVAATEGFFLNGNGLFDLATGRTLATGIDATVAAVTADTVVHARGNAILTAPIAPQTDIDRRGAESATKALGPSVPLMNSPLPAVRSLIVAGNSIVTGGENGVCVLDRESKEVLFSAEVDGTAYALAMAGGRLFVGTDSGKLYAFEAGYGGEPEHRKEDVYFVKCRDGDAAVGAAIEILRTSSVTEGYCVDLGCGDGALSEALAARTGLTVYAIDADPQNVASARQRLAEQGLYGTRVTVHQGDPSATGYPSRFADLIVSGRALAEGSQAVSQPELQRLLRPYGGVGCVGRPSSLKKTVGGPLAGAGTWTHQYADAGNTGCSDDALAAGPLGMLWFDDLNFTMPNRHGRGPAPLFLDGRVFIEGRDAVRCISAYNGRTLWEHPLPKILTAYDQEHLMGTAGTGSNVCATPEGVYIVRDDVCRHLHPSDGTLLASHRAPKLPDGRPGVWSYVACVGDTLFGSVANTEHLVKYRYGRSDMSTQYTESQLLFALDAKSGRPKWAFTPSASIRNNTIAVAGGRVYLIDRELANRDDARRGQKDAPHRPGVLAALDAQTGKTLWKQTEDIYGTMLIAAEEYDVLLMAYQDTRFKLDSEAGGRMTAFRPQDGKRLWDVEARYGSRPIVVGRTIYAQPGAWDLLSGEAQDFQFARSYGCGILAGSKNLLTYRSATLGYTDLRKGSQVANYGGIRPGCWINAVPAGGLVLMPDATDRCSCSYLIKASIALQPMD